MFFKKYTEEELKTYWIARCPECGWVGLSRDCNGFEQIGITGDYDDGYCPKCGSIIEEDKEVPKILVFKWVWRKLTFWRFRKLRKEKKEEEKWAKRMDELIGE